MVLKICPLGWKYHDVEPCSLKYGKSHDSREPLNPANRVLSQNVPSLLALKVHQALKEHVARLTLRGLLESYCDDAREYEGVRNDINRQLAKKEVDLKSRLSAQVSTSPWAAVLLALFEKGDPRASGRSYAENKTEDGSYWPCWGEFNLTRSPVPAADLSSVVQAHRKLQSTLEAYLPKLRGRRDHLRQLADLIVEELDVFLLKRLVPGRCRYCPL